MNLTALTRMQLSEAEDLMREQGRLAGFLAQGPFTFRYKCIDSPMNPILP